MKFKRIKKLPSVRSVRQRYPLSLQSKKKIEQDRREIKAILEGRDSRLLMIVGPCSAWPKEAVMDYAKRLYRVSEEVKHALKIVMRLYIQKPRTTKGWTGSVNQPDPFGQPDIQAGIHYVREMMVNVVELGLPIADECLFTHNLRGFYELVSWFAIGARSSEDHEHRIFASAANCAVGLKNPTHGSLTVAVNSVVAAQHPHVAAIGGYEVETSGNPHAHLVLRGCNQGPNYSIAHLTEIAHNMKLHPIQNPAVLIDVSHDNCILDGKKRFERQPAIIQEIMQMLKSQSELRRLVKGFMVESYLKPGHQQLELGNPARLDRGGLSITDPCLGWEETESLLYEMAAYDSFSG